MTPEQALLNAIRLKLSEMGILNWRNNTGALRDREGRLIKYGLCVGSSDIIGITPQGRFIAIEVKLPGKKLTKDQQKFLRAIEINGGIAGVCHSVEEAEWLVLK